MAAPLHVVTGALGYTGRSLTERLLAAGARVRTLTNSPNRPNPFGPALDIHPLAFDDEGALARSLEGAAVLHNTYWVRFNHRLFTFDQAVRNTRRLFDAAKRAGVGRIVHVSILHADKADDLAYYRGKHQLEDALADLALPHAIIRPGVLFGRGDILVNNIAWALRRLPVFGLFGDGRYRLRPLHVDDMAALMLDHASRQGNTRADAVGPEAFEYRDLVRTIAATIALRRPTLRLPPRLAHAFTKPLDPILGDVVLTWEEVLGLMRGLLDSDAPAAGPTRLTDWARAHQDTLGRRYASEIARRVQRAVDYQQIR
ncbi:MAG: NAD-dependent epimerase/dehydratase family protein [Phycisphaerae bacterium]|nr:NAD-dependent epimerase/dehydratase family protein [Phycisphaerae bacterium]